MDGHNCGPNVHELVLLWVRMRVLFTPNIEITLCSVGGHNVRIGCMAVVMRWLNGMVVGVGERVVVVVNVINFILWVSSDLKGLVCVVLWLWLARLMVVMMAVSCGVVMTVGSCSEMAHVWNGHDIAVFAVGGCLNTMPWVAADRAFVV